MSELRVLISKHVLPTACGHMQPKTAMNGTQTISLLRTLWDFFIGNLIVRFPRGTSIMWMTTLHGDVKRLVLPPSSTPLSLQEAHTQRP